MLPFFNIGGMSWDRADQPPWEMLLRASGKLIVTGEIGFNDWTNAHFLSLI